MVLVNNMFHNTLALVVGIFAIVPMKGGLFAGNAWIRLRREVSGFMYGVW